MNPVLDRDQYRNRGSQNFYIETRIANSVLTEIITGIEACKTLQNIMIAQKQILSEHFITGRGRGLTWASMKVSESSPCVIC